jgi:hypothetical protein
MKTPIIVLGMMCLVCVCGHGQVIQDCSEYSGGDASAKIAAAISALPASGGGIACYGFRGNQNWGACPFTGVRKPVTVQLGAAEHRIAVDCSIPPNVSIEFGEGSTLLAENGVRVNYNGGIINAANNQIFNGPGTFTIASTKVENIVPQWWGAKADNSTDDTAAINKALAAASTPKVVFLPRGTYKVSNALVIPESVLFHGIGRGSQLMSAIPQAAEMELVRLDGDYAAIENMWLHGPGSVPDKADGNRGIWIGHNAGGDYHADPTAATNYARVKGVVIDQFTGNGISGVYNYATITDNVIFNNTDANIFLPPPCTNNLIEGNTLYGSRYSGIDINGSSNRIIGNSSSNNGGGVLDQASWSGIMVSYIPGTAPASASNNIIQGNITDRNEGCGIRVYGLATTAGIVNAPYHNTINGNIATNHTTAAGRQTEWSGGFCILGGNDNIVQRNIAVGNVFNYVATGFSPNGDSVGTQIINNQSFNAAESATLTAAGKPSGVGYFFPATRVDGTGNGMATHLMLKDNWDHYAASDSYRIDRAGSTGSWAGWTITGNRFSNSGGYGFNLASPAAFTDYFFDQSNYGTGAALGAVNGFSLPRAEYQRSKFE